MAGEGLAYLSVVGEQLLQAILNLLGQMGVPESQRLMVAYGCCYAVVTLLILFLVWRMIRRRIRPQKKAEVEKGDEELIADSAPLELATDAQPEIATVEEPELSLFERMKAGLSKTQSALLGRVDALFSSSSTVDADFLEELEEILITADFGMRTTQLYRRFWYENNPALA